MEIVAVVIATIIVTTVIDAGVTRIIREIRLTRIGK
jgi:hypothetical protein